MINKSDIIHIQNIRVNAILGLYPEERVSPQDFIVSAKLYLDLKKAGASDDEPAPEPSGSSTETPTPKADAKTSVPDAGVKASPPKIKKLRKRRGKGIARKCPKPKANEHNVFTHFPKSEDCDVCNSCKVQRGRCANKTAGLGRRTR